MITIGKDYIGIGKIVDYNKGKILDVGINIPVRRYEFGFNDVGLYIVKNRSLCDSIWFKSFAWIHIVTLLLIQSIILNLIIIFR
jgi:hypothetical protein